MVKHHYTNETFLYVIASTNRTEGDNADCNIPMGCYLPHDVSYFICTPIFFNSTNRLLDIPPSGCFIVEGEGIVQNSISTHRKNHHWGAITPPIRSGEEHFRAAHSFNTNSFQFICRNFNNESIHFVLRNCDGFTQNCVALSGWKKCWILYLAMTPIRECPQRGFVPSESFTYVISSSQAIEGSAHDCLINLPAIIKPYHRYFVDVIACIVNNDSISLGPVRFINIYSYGWKDSGYGYGGLQGDPKAMIIGSPYCLDSQEPSHFSGDSACFIVNNMDRIRPVRFQMYQPHGPPVEAAEINLNGETTIFTIICRITPVVE